MKNLRFWFGDALICLPLVTSIAGGWLFFRTEVPLLERQEAERVRAAYREIAVDIRDGDRGGIQACSPTVRKGNGRLGKGVWGYEPTADGMLVWYRPVKSPQCVGAVVPPFRAYDYRRRFGVLGVGLLALLIVLTDLGLRFFRRCTCERDDFLASAAHDLATPLVAMRRLIGRDDGTAQLLNERMVRLVENIRDYLQLGGRRPVTLSEFPVGKAFDEAYRLFADDFADTDSGPVTVTGDTALQVCADETMLVQVFWNLLGNELKYAAHYGPVSAHFMCDGDSVVFMLADSGPGMTACQRRHIFDRYYRARTALESGKGGFGIGLCNAREFVRRCGGELTVAANPPSGSVFTLRLPHPQTSPLTFITCF